MAQQRMKRLMSDPYELVAFLWRRKWVLVGPLVVLGALGGVVAQALPNMYEASTSILVEGAEVPEQYVRSLATMRIEDRLAMLNQQVLSRARLEAVILEFDLYRDERATHPIDTVIERMRGAIDFRVRRADSFTIRYRGRDPEVVRDVTNRLAVLFIEENSKVREQQASGTAEFLETQLAALKQVLSDQDRRVKEFKERYLGELPQQQEATLRTLDRLQLQQQSIMQQLRSTEERRQLLQVQLAQMPRENEVFMPVMRPRSEAVGAPGAGLATGQAARDPVVVRLEEARTMLAQLQSKYTDAHPEVVRARRQLAELQARLASQGQEAGGVSEQLVPVPELRRVPNPLVPQTEAQIAASDREIAALRQSLTQLDEQLRALQRKVQNVPHVEQQLRELTRDYDNTQRQYDDLLKKKLDAQVAESLEKRQKAGGFRVLDPATTPQTPDQRTRWLVAGGALLLGLGLGLGATFGLEALDHSVRDVRDVKEMLPQLAVLGTVTVVPTRAGKRRAILREVAAATLVLALLAGVLAGGQRYGELLTESPLVSALVR
jgi:succinoglycan biosynthesis transport protein ExoP